MNVRRFGLVVAALGVVAALAGPAGPASAATALPAPGTPVLTQVTMTSTAFTWAASTGPVANYTVKVIDQTGGTYHDIATTSATSYTHTGLTADHNYVYKVVANPQAGSGFTTSPDSGLLYVTTLPLPDSIPPTKPGTPTASNISTIGATLTYFPSTDNNRVAGYVAQRQINGVWTDVTTNNNTTIYPRGLNPNTTYTMVIVAFDPNGNRSPRSDPVTFTTRPLEPLPACRIKLNNLGSMWLASITVENMTAAMVLENWTLNFTLPTTHTFTYVANFTLARTGTQVVATPAVWFNRVTPSLSFVFALGATMPSGSALPSGFTVVGSGVPGPLPCTVT